MMTTEVWRPLKNHYCFMMGEKESKLIIITHCLPAKTRPYAWLIIVVYTNRCCYYSGLWLFQLLNSLLIIGFAIVLRPPLLFQCPEWFSSYFHRLLLTAVSIFQIGICNIHKVEVISQTSSLLKTQNWKFSSVEDVFYLKRKLFARNWLIFASLLDLICFASHQSSVSELFFTVST